MVFYCLSETKLVFFVVMRKKLPFPHFGGLWRETGVREKSILWSRLARLASFYSITVPLVGTLVRLFNISLRLGEVPEEWKDAVFIPLHKGGKKLSKDPLSYRPISLTSCVARVLEKSLNIQIRKYLEVKKLIHDHQCGFLPQHSTVTQLCYLTHEWTMALDQRQGVQAAFLELSKAYNRVPTEGLLFELSGCGFSPHSLKWMNSFLANCRQRVKVGNMHSEWATLSCGIPQGTVLGPTLFLVFINDLPTHLVGKPSIFADDSTKFSRGNNKLETCQALSKDLDFAQDWAVTWGVLLMQTKVNGFK